MPYYMPHSMPYAVCHILCLILCHMPYSMPKLYDSFNSFIITNFYCHPNSKESTFLLNGQLQTLTPILSKVLSIWYWLRLGRFMECQGVLPIPQSAYGKGLGTCDALLCVAHTLQSALEMGQEVRMVQIDFSAAFDRVNHQGILYKLCTVRVGGLVLSVLTHFLSNRSLYVVVDGSCSKLVNVVSGVLQGSVLGPQLFLLYTAELFSKVENKLYGYADDSTLVAVVPSPAERVAVTESMNRDLDRVSVWSGE